MKIYKNVKLHRNKGTIYFRLTNKDKEIIIPFIQFLNKQLDIFFDYFYFVLLFRYDGLISDNGFVGYV